MTATTLTVLRRRGALWGISSARVRAVRRCGDGVRIELGDRSLIADDIECVAAGLEIRAAGALLQAYYPEPCIGLAVFGGEPVLVVRPEAPPRALCADERGEKHAR